MSIYNNADTERVYRIAREYVEETQRYVRMIIEADPDQLAEAADWNAVLDDVWVGLDNMKQDWQERIAERNPDWEPLK